MGGGRRRKEELTRQRARRRRMLRLTGVVAVAAASVVVAALVAGGQETEEGGETLPDLARRSSRLVAGEATNPLGVTDEPTAYRIDYRVHYRSGTTNAERVYVRRPFESRTEIYIGKGVRGRPDQVRESRFGVVATQSAGDEAAAFAVGPAVPDADVRAGPALSDALDADVLERRERRRVAGRICDVYRAGGSVVTGALRPATRTDHTDVCIDAAGLVLEVWQVVDGEPLQQRVARTVLVGDAAGVTDEVFTLPRKPAEPGQGGGSVGPVEPGSAPEGPALVVDDPMTGFAFQGRYAVVPGQPALADPARQGEAVAGLADVWVAGIDFVVVEQSGRLDQGDPFSYGDGTTRVRIEGLAVDAEVRPSLAGSEMRALLGGGRFVRVYGTVSVERLTAVARSLRAVEGTGLVVIDPPSG